VTLSLYTAHADLITWSVCLWRLHVLHNADITHDRLELPGRAVQAYEAADAHLRRFHPSWCGLDAVVSLGRFSCSGEGLVALLQAKPPDTRELYDSDLDR